MILLSRIRFIPGYDIGVIMTGSACGAGNAYHSGAPDFTSGFHRVSCCHVICVSLFHVIVLSFGFFLLFDWLVSIIFTLVWTIDLRRHILVKMKYISNTEECDRCGTVFNIFDCFGDVLHLSAKDCHYALYGFEIHV